MIKTSLTDKQSCIHIGVFAQQLLAHVNSWIVLILNAQQDLILQHKKVQTSVNTLSPPGRGANRIAKWGSHMGVGSHVAAVGRSLGTVKLGGWGSGFICHGNKGGRSSQPHLGVVQGEKGLQVGDEVGVDAFQRLQQRNSHHLRKRLFDL